MLQTQIPTLGSKHAALCFGWWLLYLLKIFQGKFPERNTISTF